MFRQTIFVILTRNTSRYALCIRLIPRSLREIGKYNTVISIVSAQQQLLKWELF